MSTRTKHRSCCGMRAPTRTRLSVLSSLLPCSIRQTRSRDPHARVKKGIGTCAPMAETPVVVSARASGFTIRRRPPPRRTATPQRPQFCELSGRPAAERSGTEAATPADGATQPRNGGKRRRVGGIISDAAPRLSPARPARFNLICVLGHQGVTRAGPAASGDWSERSRWRSMPGAPREVPARTREKEQRRGRTSRRRSTHGAWTARRNGKTRADVTHGKSAKRPTGAPPLDLPRHGPAGSHFSATFLPLSVRFSGVSGRVCALSATATWADINTGEGGRFWR